MEIVQNYNHQFLSNSFSIVSVSEEFNMKKSSIFNEEDLKSYPNINVIDWKFMVCEWMPNSAKKYYLDNLDKIYNSSHLFLIKGLCYEYGINTSIDYHMALNFYHKSIKLNNQIAFMKLFFIYSKLLSEPNSFSDVELDIDFAIFCLIKSACYTEMSFEVLKVDTSSDLLKFINLVDKDLIRIKKVLVKMLDHDIANTDKVENEYLEVYLKLNRSLSISDFKKEFKRLEDLAFEKNHYEACFKLACIYFYPPNELCPKKIDIAEKLLSFLYSKGYVKSFFSYYKLLEELGDQESLVKKFPKELLLEMKQFSYQIYTSHLIRDSKNLYENSFIILDAIFFQFLAGSIMCAIVSFEIITQVILKNKIAGFENSKISSNNYYKLHFLDNYVTDEGDDLFLSTINQNENIQIKEKIFNSDNIGKNNIEKRVLFYLQVIYDFCFDKNNKSWIIKAVDYDIFVLFYTMKSYFFYKGLIVKKDLFKAKELLEEAFIDKKSFKNYRKTFYYLGKINKKINEIYTSNIYLYKTVKIYLLSCEFPYHFYILGKLFYTGVKGYMNRNKIRSAKLLYFGMTFHDSNYFINVLYSTKCKEKIEYLSTIDEEFKNEFETISDYYLNFDKNQSQSWQESSSFSKSGNILNKEKSLFEEKFNALKNEMINEIIDEKYICTICCHNVKQIIFYTCGHKFICNHCLEKLKFEDNVNKKCPMCNKLSSKFIVDMEWN